MNDKPIRPRRIGRGVRFRRCAVEQCEPRTLLDSDGFVLPDSPQLTLSFAPDGTDIAGQPNTLSSKFAALGPDWQQTIAAGFQAWASQTNADIGLVPDDGSAFGVSGLRQGDARFGDLRIGARPLAADVAAIAVSHRSMIAGTWAGDVILNSDLHFDSLDELYSVAIHEAGHVFGLEHSAEPGSVMFVHGISDNRTLTAADVANIQSLYGVRQADRGEVQGGFPDNDTIERAAELETGEAIEEQDGTAPSLAFGDLSSAGDVDVYELKEVEDYTGPLTVRVVTSGLSLLQPRLTILDEDGVVLARATSAGMQANDLVLTLAAIDSEQPLFLQVDSLAADAFARGAYSLVATFDELNVVDADTIDEIARSPFRRLVAGDFDDFFDDDATRFLREDQHTDDDLDSANELLEMEGFGAARQFEFIGSLSDTNDRDTFAVNSPPASEPPTDVLTLLIQSTDVGGLIPQLALYDANRAAIPFQTLINGNGELVVQAVGISAGAEYLIELSASSQTTARQGNYQLNLAFSGTRVDRTQFAQGTVDHQTQAHRLHVATPQLFHFALSVAATTEPRAAVLGRILAADGRVVYQVLTVNGQTRTAGSVLLNPGTYTFTATRLVATAGEVRPLTYSLEGVVVSDPFGIDPLEPSGADFRCPNLTGVFCYPNGIMSVDPFLWEVFLSTQPDNTNLDPAAWDAMLEGAWWNWYQAESIGNQPPIGLPDRYQLARNEEVLIAPTEGVLANDVDPNLDGLTAIVQAPPQHGELLLDEDGGFWYLPNTDFVGQDSFTYFVADAISVSAPIRVTLDVTSNGSTRGDFDQSGVVDVYDLDLLGYALRTGLEPQFDLNADGQLNDLDWRTMVYDVLTTSFGDANLDGQFDSSDLVLVFQAGEYEDSLATNSTWAGGDWNGDGEFSSADIIFAFQTGGYSTQAAAVRSLRRTGLASPVTSDLAN